MAINNIPFKDANTTTACSAAFGNGSSGSPFAPLRGLTDGDNQVTVTSASQLNVNIGAQTSDLTIADGGNSITVDNGGTFPVQVDAALPAGTNLIGNAKLSDGTDTANITSSSHLQVELASDLVGFATSALQANKISTNNSTTSTLTGDAVYTGTGDDISGYSGVSVQIDASHDSAVDGMTFQFSTDNSNWDDIYAFTYTAANGARRFQFPATAQYFRVVYTNGSTEQTHFRLQTILHRTNILTSSHRLSDNVSPDRSANLVKAAIFAQAAGSGDFTAIDATAGGNLKVALEENDAGNLTTNTVQLGGTAISVNSGTVDTGTQRVTIATDDTVTVDNSGTFAVQSTLQAGTANVGNVNITDGTDKVSVTSSSQLNVNIDAQTADLTIADGGNSLTVDAPLGSELYTRISDGTDTATISSASHLLVDIANDSVGIGGGTQYATDVALGATACGTLMIAKRDDALSNLTPVEGDAIGALVDSRGALWTNVANGTGASAVNVQDGGNSLTVDAPLGSELHTKISDGTDTAGVTAASHLLVDIANDSVGIGGGTQYAVDVALGATACGTLMVGRRDDALSNLTPAEGDAVDAKFDSVGALWTNVANGTGASAVNIQDGGNSLTVDAPLGSELFVKISDGTDSAIVSSASHLLVDIANDSVGIGGGTQYATDVALGATACGTLMIGKRDDALSNLTPVEGDAVGALVDSRGALWVTNANGAGASAVNVQDGGNSLTVDAPLGSELFTKISDGTDTATVSSASHLLVDIANDSVGIGGGTQYAVDTALGATACGTLMIGRRDDALSNLTPVADDAVEARFDSVGALWTNVANGAGASAVNIQDGGNAITVDNGGTFAVQSTLQAGANDVGSVHITDGTDTANITAASHLQVEIANDAVGIGGGTQYAVDTALGATACGTLMVGRRDDALSNLTPVEGDAVDAKFDSVGALWVNVANGTGASAVSIQDGGNTITVDNGGTFPVQVDAAIPAGTNNIGSVQLTDGTDGVTVTSSSQLNVNIDAQTADLTIADGGNKITVDWNGTDPPIGAGTEAAALRVTVATDSTGVLSVDDNNGSLTVDAPIGTPVYASISDGTDSVSVTSGSYLNTISASTGGDTAHNAVDAGNPIKIGGRAQSASAFPDESADNDRVDALYDMWGYQRVRGDFEVYSTAINHATSGCSILISSSAGKRIAIWNWNVISDGTVDVRLRDGESASLTGQYPFQAREGIVVPAGGLTPLYLTTSGCDFVLELSAAVNVHGSVSWSIWGA